MIILRVHVTTKLKTGKLFSYSKKVIHKWPNSELENFDFDVFDPLAWKKYLRDEFILPSTNKKLPFLSKFNEMLVYEVYIFGVPKELHDKASFYSNNHSSFLNLFPGYPGESDKFRNADGKIKPRKTTYYGSIK